MTVGIAVTGVVTGIVVILPVFSVVRLGLVMSLGPREKRQGWPSMHRRIQRDQNGNVRLLVVPGPKSADALLYPEPGVRRQPLPESEPEDRISGRRRDKQLPFC